MKILKKIIFILTPYERKLATILLGMILVMAFLDMLGIASIMPFITILANPEIIETNTILNKVFVASGMLGVETKKQFIFVFGIFVFFLLVFSLAFKAFTIYSQIRFSAMREYSIGKRLVSGFLHQPYSWFLNRHSADLGKTILSEVSLVISHGIKPIMNLITYSTITIMLVTLLILVDPKLSMIVGFTLGTAYGVIYKFTRSFLKRIGEERMKANKERFTIITEAFGAAKEIKVGGLEQVYTKRFSGPAKIAAQHAASAQLVGNLPRYALEAIAFGGMVLVVLYLMSRSGTFIEALPIISLYAFAGYRLIPAIQQIYVSLSQLRYIGSSLDELYDDLTTMQSISLHQSNDALPLNETITLNRVNYHYPKSSRSALKDISLNIPAFTTVGLVGATGSGKTTLVDIILGLFEAQQGTLEVDGQVINKLNLRAWQKSIGYVPQQIFLADDTVAANIAFGIEHKDIDQVAVERAAKISNLHDFVINELPLKYQTTIGERGVRLSGGQRQRIGIARALYHNPKVLILDEATSALDNLTEQAVMEAVHNLGKNITVILIAHRLSTVKKCDTIFLLEKGELKEQGTFEELIQANDNFRATASNL
jgi:ATP-binding cassette, subfamily B, bacterial PglK